GDEIIIAARADVELDELASIRPRVAIFDEQNRLKQIRELAYRRDPSWRLTIADENPALLPASNRSAHPARPSGRQGFASAAAHALHWWARPRTRSTVEPPNATEVRMFRFFETLVDPFPPGEPREPPRKLLPFLLHISRPVLPWLALMSVLTALVSVAEVALFGYIGSLVDWLADADRGSFLAEHGKGLALVALAIAIGLPMLVLAQSLVVHQTIFGNYPMLVRWIGHRYVLRQSLRFFQDELA